jgi:hypothetical protein
VARRAKDKLIPAGDGLFALRPEIDAEVRRTLPPLCQTPVRFMLSVEISTIYKKTDRTERSLVESPGTTVIFASLRGRPPRGDARPVRSLRQGWWLQGGSTKMQFHGMLIIVKRWISGTREKP